MPIAKCLPNITLDLIYLEKVWSPNTCIVNSKAAVIHNSPNPNVFLILYRQADSVVHELSLLGTLPNNPCSDGRVWKNCRMMVTAPCEIDLRKFPFDQQTCTMTFESYSYNVQKVQYGNETHNTCPMCACCILNVCTVDYCSLSQQIYTDSTVNEREFKSKSLMHGFACARCQCSRYAKLEVNITTRAQVQLQWLEEAPITFVKELNLPDFTLVHTHARYNLMGYPNGYWDQVRAEFTFKRRSGVFCICVLTQMH